MAAKPKTKDTREKKNRKLTRKDVQKAATRCKNWGRWGKDDEIGTLNFTTPEDIVAAAQLVKKRQGLRVSVHRAGAADHRRGRLAGESACYQIVREA